MGGGRDAPVEVIEEAIRPGGISKIKSARIKSILAAMTSTAPGGALALEWLASSSVPEAQAYLCALPGVGRKTAACVLLFSYGMRDVPVDTHVSRVGTRLGLLPPGAAFEELHDVMLAHHTARAGARVPHEPAPPRPAHLSRPAPRVRSLRAAAHVPLRGHVRLVAPDRHVCAE